MSKISYDPEVGILTIRISDKKITDSDIIKNCIIDYDKSGGIVSIEVMNIDLEKILRPGRE